MPEEGRISIDTGGWRCEGSPWQPLHPWVGTLDLAPDDRRAELLEVAAEAREAPLRVLAVDPPVAEARTTLRMIAEGPSAGRPRGLLVGEFWQEEAAARCRSLTGVAADLGLADALRLEDSGDWLGHHLLGGAFEAFLAQVWPEDIAPPERAVVHGWSPTAVVAGFVAARRGSAEVVFLAGPSSGDALRGRLEQSVNWPEGSSWRTSQPSSEIAGEGGLWIRADRRVRDPREWLPDAAGDGPCLLVDLMGRTEAAPLGFAHPDPKGIQVMAAGLASAWYLGPPVPWDALTAASFS